MKSRLRLFLLGLNLLLCASFAIAWARSRQEHHQLSDRLSRAQSEETSQKQSVAILRQKSEAQLAELAHSQTIIGSSRAPEVIRRDLALREIDRLKQAHALNPPPPLPKKPPLGNFGSTTFNELMPDPEYSRLTFLSMRLMFQSQHEGNLKKLGLTPATSEKVIDLLADKYMTTLDYRQLLGDQTYRGSAYDVQKKETDQIEREIRMLMTEDQYTRFAKFQDYAALENMRSYFSNLTLRLSYTSSPLDSEKLDKLAAQLAQQTGPKKSPYRVIASDDFIDSTRALLTPGQHAALVQLQAEQHAKEKRGKLPKSSEIPRL
jgi:hypothetical protein